MHAHACQLCIGVALSCSAYPVAVENPPEALVPPPAVVEKSPEACVRQPSAVAVSPDLGGSKFALLRTFFKKKLVWPEATVDFPAC